MTCVEPKSTAVALDQIGAEIVTCVPPVVGPDLCIESCGSPAISPVGVSDTNVHLQPCCSNQMAGNMARTEPGSTLVDEEDVHLKPTECNGPIVPMTAAE